MICKAIYITIFRATEGRYKTIDHYITQGKPNQSICQIYLRISTVNGFKVCFLKLRLNIELLKDCNIRQIGPLRKFYFKIKTTK